jgi:hypothetical protein
MLASGLAGAAALAQRAHAAPITTVTLSRSAGDTVANNMLQLVDGTTSNGTNSGNPFSNPATVNVGTLVAGGHYYYYRAVIRFDLSSLPAHSTIQSATLTFHSGAGGAGTSIYRLTNSFTQTGVTWESRNGTNDWSDWATSKDQDRITTATSAGTGAINSLITYDVTTDVQLLANGTPNDGWVILGPENGSPSKPPTGSSSQILYLSSSTANEPVLKITYSVPEPASLSLLGMGGLLLLRRRTK